MLACRCVGVLVCMLACWCVCARWGRGGGKGEERDRQGGKEGEWGRGGETRREGGGEDICTHTYAHIHNLHTCAQLSARMLNK